MSSGTPNRLTVTLATATPAQPRPVPYLRILRQPSSVYRMRYKAEKRSTFLCAEDDSLSSQQQTLSPSPSPSPSNTSGGGRKPARKTNNPVFPAVEIVNGKGPATLIVSCVRHKEPRYVHPHKLTGACCRSGVAVINIGENQTVFELSGISIEFTKQAEIEQSISELKLKNVDPFNVGFDFDRKEIDMTKLCLCFQVYLRDSTTTSEIVRDRYHILSPVVSSVIRNSSGAQPSLVVQRTLHMHAPADGNNEVVVFMRPLNKHQKPLYAKFYEDDLNWSAEVPIKEIHNQCAFVFRPPAYKNKDIRSDQIVSLKFYVPFDNEEERMRMIQIANSEASTVSGRGGSGSGGISGGGSGSGETADNDSGVSLDDEEDESARALVLPDGKFESSVFEFTYTPIVIPNMKRKNENMHYFESSENNERDGNHTDMPEEVRRNLMKRQTRINAAAANIEESLDSAAIKTDITVYWSDSTIQSDAGSINQQQQPPPLPPPPVMSNVEYMSTADGNMTTNFIDSTLWNLTTVQDNIDGFMNANPHFIDPTSSANALEEEILLGDLSYDTL